MTTENQQCAGPGANSARIEELATQLHTSLTELVKLRADMPLLAAAYIAVWAQRAGNVPEECYWASSE